MSSIVHTIRLVTSAAQAIAEVQKYQNAIVGVAQTVEKHANTLSGDKLLKSANEWTAAVAKLGGASNNLATSEQILAGASKLTATEKARLNATVTEAIAKYQALGQSAPKAMTDLEAATRKTEPPTSLLSTAIGKLAAGITLVAVGRLAKDAVDLAGHLTDLSAKTGLTTTELQRFKFAAEQNGATLETVTRGVSLLSDRLAGGDKAAVTALRTLNLSFEELRASQPGAAFEQVSSALAKIPDPMQRTKIAMDLFGRSGVELLPVVTANMKELGDQAESLGLVMSEDVVKGGDDLGDTFDQLLGIGKSLIVSVLAPFTPLLNGIATALRFVSQGVGVLIRGMVDLLLPTERLKEAWEIFRGQLDTPEVPRAKLQMAEMAGAVQLTDREIRNIERDLEKERETLNKATEEAKKHAEALQTLRDKLTGDALLGDINNLLTVWRSLTPEQQKNETIVARVREEYGRLREHTDKSKLPAELEAVYFSTIKVTQGLEDLWPWISKLPLALQGVEQQAPKAGIAMQAFGAMLGRSVGLESDPVLGIEEILKSMRELEREAPPKAAAFATAWRGVAATLDSLAGSFAQLAQVTDGAISAAAKRIGEFVSVAGIAAKAGGGMRDTLDGMKDKSIKAGEGVAQLTVNLIAAAGAFLQATSSSSRFENAMGGLITGFTTGVALGGAYGGVVGGIAGAVLGLMRDTGKMSDAVYRSQMALLAQREAMARAEAEAQKLSAAIAKVATAADDLSLEEVGFFEKVITERDMPRIRELSKALTEGVGNALRQIGQIAASSGAIFNRQMIDFIRHAKDAGVATADLAALMQQQQEASSRAFGELIKNADLSKTSLDTIITSFDLIKNSGIDLQAFFAANGTSIMEFRDRMKDAGLEGSEAFRVIAEMAAEAGNEIASKAVTQAKAAMDVAVALHNQSLLSAEGFRTFTAQISHAANVLREQGVVGDDVLRRLREQIQRAWEMEQQFGYQVDAGTRELIDQGIAAGLVGQQHKSAAQQQIDAMNSVVATLRELIELLRDVFDATGKTGEAADGAAQQYENWRLRTEPNLRRIRDSTLEVESALRDTEGAARGLSGAFADAEAAADNFARTTADKMAEARAAINDVIQMRSPTGIEGIVYYTNLATAAMERFGAVASGNMAMVASAASRVDLTLDRIAKSSVARGLTSALSNMRGLDRQDFSATLQGMAGMGTGLAGKMTALWRGNQLAGAEGFSKDLLGMRFQMADEIGGLGPDPSVYRHNWEMARDTLQTQLRYQLEDLQDARTREIKGLGPLPDVYDVQYAKATAKAARNYDKQVKSLEDALDRELKQVAEFVRLHGGSYDEMAAAVQREHAFMLDEAKERYAAEIENLGPIPSEYRAIYEEALQAVDAYYTRMEARAKESADNALHAIGPIPDEYDKQFGQALLLVGEKYRLMVEAAAKAAKETVDAWQVVLSMFGDLLKQNPNLLPPGMGGGGTPGPVVQMMTEAQALARLVAVLGRQPSDDELAQLIAAIGHTRGAMVDPAKVRQYVPGFRQGTNGFVDFGHGTLAMLHGREAVVPEGRAGEFGGSKSNVHDDEVHQAVERLGARLDRLDDTMRRALGDLPGDLVRAIRVVRA